MANRNLEPGQYQIGDFVFGEHTLFNVESMDIGAYEVNVQDFQVPISDELRFGQDSLKPMPIQLTINARRNFLLPNMAALAGGSKAATLNFDSDRRPGEFAKEWRSDEIRNKWGELKPLLICREDGRVVRVYGRPGKLAVPPLGRKGQNQKIVAEFRRSDTLCYSDVEWYTALRANEIVTITRAEDFDMGNAPCWLRFLLVGPMKHPIIQLGSLVIELNAELDIGDVVEISSYPWQRRVVRANDGLSLNAQLLSPYLDKLKFDAESGVELSWTATDINSSVEAIDFSTYTDGPIPTADWWVDHAADGGAGDITVTDGLVVFNDSGNETHLVTMVYKTPTVTKYQRLEFRTPTAPEGPLPFYTDEATNRIIGRSNADRTEYLFWEISRNYLWFGYRKDGADHRLKKWELNRLCQTLKIIWGNLWDSTFGNLFEATDNWIWSSDFGTGAGELSSHLYINNHLFATYNGDDEEELSFFGSQHIYVGQGFKATPRGFGQSTPGTISYLNFRDNPPPEIADSLNVSTIFMLWRDAWQTI